MQACLNDVTVIWTYWTSNIQSFPWLACWPCRSDILWNWILTFTRFCSIDKLQTWLNRFLPSRLVGALYAHAGIVEKRCELLAHDVSHARQIILSYVVRCRYVIFAYRIQHTSYVMRHACEVGTYIHPTCCITFNKRTYSYIGSDIWALGQRARSDLCLYN